MVKPVTKSRWMSIRFGIALLPWCPLLLVWGVIWSHFWGPKMIHVSTLSMTGGISEVSAADQLAQMAPFGRAFIWLFGFSAIAFAIGIGLIVVAWVRRACYVATPTI
jgi:hypothetical protein